MDDPKNHQKNRISEMRVELGGLLLTAESLKVREGLTTGIGALDRYLSTQGVPIGEMSLFQAPLGLGATQLWLRIAGSVLRRERWVAWVESAESQVLNAQVLFQQGFSLERVFVVRFSLQNQSQRAVLRKGSKPRPIQSLFWILQELIQSDLFTLIGAPFLLQALQHHQLIKLKRLAREHNTSLIFLAHENQTIPVNLFSLILSLTATGILVERAKRVKTPHLIEEEQKRSLFPTSSKTISQAA